MGKQVILLNWSYYRKDWIQPFIALKDSFEFIFISYVNRKYKHKEFPFKQVFWEDFESAINLLDEIRPAKIVFMSIDSGYSIALNFAALKRKTPTYILQHGLYHDYEFYRKMEVFNKELGVSRKNEAYQTNRVDTLRFISKSLSPQQYIHFPFIVTYLALVGRRGINWATKKMKPFFVQANNYICYTKFNGRIYKEREGIDESKIIEIGNPAYDSFFSKISSEYDEKFYLLIDQPLVENPFNNFTISRDQVNEFYLKINSFCKKNGAKLLIKLHPENYNSEFMVKDDNISYLKEANLPSLITNAIGCFGTFSNIIIPAIFFNKCILFRLPFLKSETQEDIIELSMVNVLDFFRFDPIEIDFSFTKVGEKDFIARYMYRADRKSLERLSLVLSG